VMVTQIPPHATRFGLPARSRRELPVDTPNSASTISSAGGRTHRAITRKVSVELERQHLCSSPFQDVHTSTSGSPLFPPVTLADG